MTISRTELDVAGVIETVLTPELLARLPENSSTAPWECQCNAVVWTALGSKSATRALPPAIRDTARALNVVGGMVRYTDTPVGSYDEVLGTIGFRHGRAVRGNVAFMAVDSEASLVGGRTNWAMPKTLATFTGEPAGGATMSAAGAVGTPWRVAATPRVLGPAVPIGSAFTVLQQFPDGAVRACKLKAKGWARPALITVDVEAETTLPDWLRSGRHLGAVIEKMTFSLGVPTELR